MIQTDGEKVVSLSAVSPFDDEAAWMTPAFSPPGDTNIEAVQKEIDSICGVTRDGKSIALLVWNGDIRFWKEVCVKWSSAGEPLEFIKRPIVLYKAIYGSHRQHIRDLFPPRWLILTRIEPEQYVHTWERDSKVFDPRWNRHIQIRPAIPPKEMYVWYATIAKHEHGCCERADKERRICYGKYVPAAAILDSLRQVRRGIDEAGLKDAPFDRPDRLTIKMREQGTSSYVEQALKTFDAQFSYLAASVPRRGARQIIRVSHQYALDKLEERIKQNYEQQQ